jgi:hypothetical protein
LLPVLRLLVTAVGFSRLQERSVSLLCELLFDAVYRFPWQNIVAMLKLNAKIQQLGRMGLILRNQPGIWDPHSAMLPGACN